METNDYMTLDELFELAPEFHLHMDGSPISWGLPAEVLRALYERVERGSATLETGSGLSTIVFVLRGCRHTAITPYGREFVAIREFCQQHGLPLAGCRLVEERSEFALPGLELDDLDLVLVDGRHGFPAPFIDWFYGAEALKVGGLMVVDDTHLETGRILKDFMNEDPCWQFADEIGNTVFFEKAVADVHLGEWTDQPYLARLAGYVPAAE